MWVVHCLNACRVVARKVIPHLPHKVVAVAATIPIAITSYAVAVSLMNAPRPPKPDPACGCKVSWQAPTVYVSPTVWKQLANSGFFSPPVLPGGGFVPTSFTPTLGPPGSTPPGSTPPGTIPPGTTPPGTTPPGTTPPGTTPPGTPVPEPASALLLLTALLGLAALRHRPTPRRHGAR